MFALPHWNVVISRGLIEELVITAVVDKEAIFLKTGDTECHGITEEAHPVFLVCGSYLSSDAIRGLQAQGPVTVWLYSDDDIAKYDDLTDLSIIRHMAPYVPEKLHPLLDRKAFPDGEDFYRGFLEHRPVSSAGGPDVLLAMVKEFADGRLGNYEHLRDVGRAIVRNQKHVAQQCVLYASIAWESLDGTRFQFVNGSHCPVMPFAEAASEHVDVGVNVRYNFLTDQTQLTFLSHNSTDLSFVGRSPINGGGKPECKGVTLSGFLNLDAICTLIERAIGNLC